MPPALAYDYATSEDYWSLPEGQRAELIDGELYSMAPPNRVHQRIVLKLAQVFQNHIDAHHGRCQVYPAPFAVNLDGDESTWVEPDVSVICDPRKLSDRGCEGAPDLVVEVVSPASRRMDYRVKPDRYRRAGVREYWIVDPSPKLRRVAVCSFAQGKGGIAQYSFDDLVPVGVLEGLAIRVTDLL